MKHNALAALLALCLLAALPGCQRTTSAREAFESGAAASGQQSQADVTETRDTDESTAQPDYKWYAGHYIEGISLQRMTDFESVSAIKPDDFVLFFMTANYDGADKLPIPEGYRSSTDGELLLPAEDVESYVTTFFDVTADTLRGGSDYNADKNVYVLKGFGISNTSSVQVTDVKTDGSKVDLVFDVYVTMQNSAGEDVTIGPTTTRDAAFEASGDSFKVLSLKTLYQGDLDKMMKDAGLS